VLTSVAGWKFPPAAGTINIDGHAVKYTIVPTGFSTTRLDPAGIQTIVTNVHDRCDQPARQLLGAQLPPGQLRVDAGLPVRGVLQHRPWRSIRVRT
jgi:hypothetical protein